MSHGFGSPGELHFVTPCEVPRALRHAAGVAAAASAISAAAVGLGPAAAPARLRLREDLDEVDVLVEHELTCDGCSPSAGRALAPGCDRGVTTARLRRAAGPAAPRAAAGSGSPRKPWFSHGIGFLKPGEQKNLIAGGKTYVDLTKPMSRDLETWDLLKNPASGLVDLRPARALASAHAPGSVSDQWICDRRGCLLQLRGELLQQRADAVGVTLGRECPADRERPAGWMPR
eukprot:gene13224-biopygen5695